MYLPFFHLYAAICQDSLLSETATHVSSESPISVQDSDVSSSGNHFLLPAAVIPESEIQYKDKQSSELEAEAENINQRNILHQKQLNIKDEDLSEEFLDDRKKISDISNILNRKVSISDSITAGINCVMRNI